MNHNTLKDELEKRVNNLKLLEQEIQYTYDKRQLADSLETAAAMNLQEVEVEKKKRESRLLWVGLAVFLILMVVLL